jgi:pimeloyl-ACP methyl ester carboxylesterase
MADSKRVRRWPKVVLWTALSLVLVFYIAGGVVFSNMIHADALTPQGPTPDNGVYVVAVGDDTITLTSEEERADTMRPGLAGLSWPGGYGTIGQITGTSDIEVTRRFALTDGPPPPICTGPLSGCDEVDIQSWTYQRDPSDVGLPFEEVSFPSPLGELQGWMVPGGDGSTVAIHAHGWRASRREALRSLRTYHEMGITSLVIEYRNDEGAPEDPSGLYKFGRSEWEDLEAAVSHVDDGSAERIVLVGYSTGAAIGLAFMENSELAGRIDAMVFDAPNIDMAETVRHEASKRTIPGTPLPVPGSLTSVAMLMADLRWDVDWEGIDYANRADESVPVPTLVFHGLDDERVPVDVARRLRDGAPEFVQLIEVPNAGHVTSWNVDPESYETTLKEFLANSLP